MRYLHSDCTTLTLPLGGILLLPEVLEFQDPPCPPGQDNDAQVETTVRCKTWTGTAARISLHPPHLHHLQYFWNFFSDGQRRYSAPGHHFSLLGPDRNHRVYNHGGVESFVLCRRQHHHSSGDVPGPVEELRLTEHGSNSVQSLRLTPSASRWCFTLFLYWYLYL